MNNKSNKVKVFVSYSWDSDEHKIRVANFVKCLRKNNFEVYYDESLALGERLQSFMEHAISNSNYVLIICTPNYKIKADNRIGGVGYENTIITAELFETRREKKYIPVLFDGTWVNSIPIWAKGKKGVDLRGNNFVSEAVSLKKVTNKIKKKI